MLLMYVCIWLAVEEQGHRAYLPEHLCCHIKHSKMHYGWRIEAATVQQDDCIFLCINWEVTAKFVSWQRHICSS